ncbi:MAG: hypothetical protein ACR2H6_04265 [Pyrinomonadaceae bacterium]
MSPKGTKLIAVGIYMWSAAAERSGDGALIVIDNKKQSGVSRLLSGLPPHSKNNEAV